MTRKGHKLISSVYAEIVIEKKGLGDREAVEYCGPSYIAIGSAKLSFSTAFSQCADVKKNFTFPEFDIIIKDVTENFKPVVIFNFDGRPDENARFVKVISVSIHHFIKYDLDALYIAYNAPGRSAFNRVEKRMALISKELAGVILSHEHYGSHLSNNG